VREGEGGREGGGERERISTINFGKRKEIIRLTLF